MNNSGIGGGRIFPPGSGRNGISVWDILFQPPKCRNNPSHRDCQPDGPWQPDRPNIPGPGEPGFPGYKPPFYPSPPPHGPWTPPGEFPDPQPGFGDEPLTDDDNTHSSPLILDLDGDGVEAGAAVFFDHEGDGFMELTRWVGEDDGMLVWDRNGDGIINDGSELFGNNTVLANGEKAANGFATLSELDSNGDSVVNSQDENFANLRVSRWTDANDNGMMDEGEERLETLTAATKQRRRRKKMQKNARRRLTRQIFFCIIPFRND